MAIVVLANGILLGLQADTKPTTYPNGTRFIESDTGNIWTYIAGAWVLTNPISPLTTLGDIPYYSTVLARLAGQTTTTKKFLNQTGNGTISAAPQWDALADADIPAALSGKTLTTSVLSTGSSLDANVEGAWLLPHTKREGGFIGGGGSTTPTYGCWDAQISNNVTGSGVFFGILIESTGACGRWQTSTTNNSLVGGRVGINTERDLNPYLIGRFRLNTITGTRFFFGWRSSSAALAGATADQLANLSGVGFWFDTGVHATNIAIMQNDGSASSDITTIPNVGTMVAVARNNFELRADNANSKFQYRFNGYPNGAWTDINTKIPIATTDLGTAWVQECTDSLNKNFDVYHVHTKMDPPS